MTNHETTGRTGEQSSKPALSRVLLPPASVRSTFFSEGAIMWLIRLVALVRRLDCDTKHCPVIRWRCLRARQCWVK